MSIPAIIYADPTKTDKRFRKQGTERLTRYELACGYTQVAETPDCTYMQGVSVALWHEGACFHVRAHDFTNSRRIFWDSFDTMTAANQRYFKAKRELGL